MITEQDLIEAGWVKELIGGSLAIEMWNKTVGRTPLTYDPDDGMIFQANVQPYKKHGFAKTVRDLYSYEEACREIQP